MKDGNENMQELHFLLILHIRGINSLGYHERFITSHHMEETEAGLQRPLYLRNASRIRRILRKILVTTLQ